ncbi:NAD(P)H-hydrate dehydratase [Chachezhania sediminis]|uniref:NAD(P)H-hydrate dehydratase n=1 Tax=Chachezhania sediminis TaxID=2599291 RepID=UPI00131C2FFC|nr:NAD(P)H-hydrate dehydratase [Chachezhania sediminis]
MTELLKASEMRALERAAIESGAVTGLELMERAGQGVVAAIFETWPELDGAKSERGAGPSRSPEYLEREEGGRRALVLCGPGNNGGDGFVVARLLRERGWRVDVFLLGDPEKLPPDAQANCQRWLAMGEVRTWDVGDIRAFYCGNEADQFVIVDALFGTGLTRPLSGDDFETLFHTFMPDAIRGNNPHRRSDKFVAIDVPSGMDSDSGRNFGGFPAHLTVTFHRAKIGHYMADECLPYGGAAGCGDVVVADIGLDEALARLPAEVRNPNGSGVCRLVGAPRKAQLDKTAASHKFSHGHALVLSGGPGRTGAARLAARAALRVGAGLVTLGVPPAAMQEVAAQVTAIMQKPVRDAAALADVLGDRRITALCLGPGLGTGSREADLVDTAVRGDHAPYGVVLDADALTLVAGDRELFGALHPRCVLTPHGGEFARLFPEIHAKFVAPAERGPAYPKVDATRDAAARAGCVVLFKGPDTVIAAPDGQVAVHAAVHDRAAPWLATAGAGDVLAGLIAGLMARGLAPMEAAEAGAWLHVECARAFGPGLIAEDLPEMLPQVLRQLGA